MDDCKQAAASLGALSDGSLLTDVVCARITSGKGRGLTLPVHIPAEALGYVPAGSGVEVNEADQMLTGYEIYCTDYFPSWVMQEDAPIVQAGVQTYRALFEKEPVVTK